MGLKKELTTFNVFSIGAGAMISSGLFILPAIAYKEAGVGSLISYALAGIFMLPSLFSKLELATAIPKAGGTYFYIERILGSGPGMIAGFANWFSIALKSALALVGIGVFATLLFPDLSAFELKLISAAACIIFTGFNIFSVKSSGSIQGILVVFLLLILTQFIITGYRIVDFSYFSTGIDLDITKILSATGIVFISYGGLTKIASIAEEVKDPAKSLVKGAVAAFIIVQAFYLLVIFVLIGVLPAEELASSYTPVSDGAAMFFTGGTIRTIQIAFTALAAIFAFITTANAGIMAASRVPMAMSRDQLLPKALAAVSEKKKTPVVSILITSAFMLIIILALDIKELAKVASLFMILLFLFVNVSLIVIRTSKLSNYKPTFKSPLYPWLQIAGIIFYIILIIGMGLVPILIASFFCLGSLCWYFVYAKKKIKRKSAFIHMIERITASELVNNEKELETELMDILLERDGIEEDRFDKIIKNAIVLDIDEPIKRAQLFKMIAEAVSTRCNIAAEIIEQKMTQREELTSTLLYPGVAIPHAVPHVIISGTHIFDIVLVRAKRGIIWNEEGEIVYTAFSLIGTKDERDMHLKSLVAIAQILQDPAFHKEWSEAKNEEDMKTTIILTKRRRNS